jgi:hypothetical protein
MIDATTTLTSTASLLVHANALTALDDLLLEMWYCAAQW